MWELDGQKFSLEQIEAILNKEKYKGSIDDFIAERGYTKVGPKVIGSSIQEPGEEVKKREDIVGEEKKQIELAQAEVDAAGPIELEEVVLTPKPKLEIEEPKYFGQEGYKPPILTWLEENNTVEITPEDNELLKISPDLLKENEVEIAELKLGRNEFFRRRTELGNPDNFLTQASVDLYNNLTQQIVKINELLEPFEDGKKMSIIQHYKNNFFNAGRDLGRIGEFWSGQGASMDIAASRLFEHELRFYNEKYGILENFDTSNLDPDNLLFEGIGEKEVYENLDNFKKNLEQRRAGIPFIETVKDIFKDAKKGDVIGALENYQRAQASAIGAIINAVGSVAYFAGTATSGYFFDFYTESWLEINEAKAARLGISIEELVKQGLDDVNTPLNVASTKSALELIGYIPLARIGSKFFKGKGITARNVAGASFAEYTTEIGQCAADVYSRVFAKTGNEDEAMKAAQSSLITQECQEQGIQGAFGALGISGLAAVASNSRLKASNNIRTIDQTQLIDKLTKEIALLQNKSANTSDPIVKKGIDSEIFDLENKVRREVINGNKIVNSLNDDQVNEVNALGDQQIEILDNVSLLVKRLSDGIVTKAEFDIAIKGYKNNYSYLEFEINNIIKDVKINPNAPEDLRSFEYTPDENQAPKLDADKDITDSEAITENITEEISDPATEGEIELDEVVVTAPAKKGNINELARIGYDNLTPEQLTDFKNQYTSVALAAIGYDPTKGSIKPEDAQSFVDEQFVIIAKNYRPRDPKTNKKIDFTTYVYNTIGRRGAALYGKQEGLEEAGQTTSLDDERAAQVADPSTVETTETVTTVQPTIGIMGKGPQAEVLESKHVALIEASPLGKEILDTGKADIAKLNKLAEDVGAVLLAEELNIPVEVINDPKLNILKKHNPSNIQRYILKNAQLILNTLKANTNVEVVGSLKNPNVKIKVGGKPLKLPRKLLDLFFDKTDIRVGNNFQYKIKPNLTVKDIQAAVGILDGKVNPNFEFAKSGEMQAAKAFLLTLSRLRTNAALEGITTGEVAGTILSATPSKVKTATERAIDYLTEQERRFKNITLIGIPPNALFSTLKGAAKIIQKSKNKINAETIAKVKKYLIDNLKKYGKLFANTIADIFTSILNKTKDLGKAIQGVIDNFISSTPSPLYNINVTQLGANKDLLNQLNVTSKNDPIVKLYIQDEVIPVLKNELTVEEKVFLLYTIQGTGSDKQNAALGRRDMIYGTIKDAMEALGLTDKQVEQVRSTLKYKNAWEFIGTKALVASDSKVVSKLEGLKTDKDLQKTVNTENKAKLEVLDNLIKALVNVAQKHPELANGLTHIVSLQSNYQGHFVRKLIPLMSFTDPSILKEDGTHDEHYSKSLATTRYIMEIIKWAAKNPNYNPTININELKKGIARGIVSKIEANTADSKKGTGVSRLISEQPVEEVYNIVQNPNLHWVLPNTEMNPSNELKSLQIIYAEFKEAQEIKKGETAITDNPDLVPTAPKDLNKDFNIILEEVKGIAAKKRFSQIVARRVGRNKGRISKFFMGPGAQDFELLYYNFLGRGRKGEQQKRFFEDNLVKPYARGIAKMEVYSQQLKDDYAALKKLMPDTAGILYNKIKGLNYTNDQALRIYLWDKAGYDIPGLSKRDRTAIVKHVQSNPNLLEFANGLTALSKQDNWVKPDAYWDTSDLLKDIYDLGHKVGRKQFLQEFINNSNEIFSESNLNKIEATYGIYLREAIENSLYRMTTGTNRKQGMDRATAAATQWISNSVGAIMFMNVRSASFQLLSMFNYINFQENNIFAIGQRILDVKQLSKDMYTILTSPKIKQRFAGEGRGIEESEIANALRNAKNKPQALLQYLLKVGFTFTRAADAMAIALGGAPYYRNNAIAFEKQGFSKEEAEAKAWEKFSETTEKFQQSADPRLLSQDQATTMGRWILAFQNTPGQYTRSIVKDMKDFVNRRRIPGLTQAQSDATYISRISYYGVIQNFVFVALANALFTLLPGWEDEEEEEMDKKAQRERNKQIRTINNMISTLLRGSGIYGAFVDTLKNVVMSYYKEQGKDPFAKDNANILVEIMNLMPTVGSKIRKINNSLKGEDYNKALIEERGWDVTIDGKVNLSPKYQVFSNLVEGGTNIPLARMTDEVTRIVEMLDKRNSTLERVALTLGYRPWDLNIPNEEHDKLRLEISDRKRREKQEKKRLEKEEKKRLEDEKRFAGKSDEEIELMKTQDKIRELTKAEQVTELEGLGLSKKDIRALRLENDRINKIIELREKKKTK
jgi:hypothetical protein